MCARKHSVCDGCPWTMGHRRRPLHAACGLKARSAAGQATRGSPMKVGHWSRMSASDLVEQRIAAAGAASRVEFQTCCVAPSELPVKTDLERCKSCNQTM